MEEEILELVEEIERKNPFCVISVETYGEYAKHDIQTNSIWKVNPYSNYAVVPDDMVMDIKATKGYCDIELNDDGTEVVSFTAREIPVIPDEEEQPEYDVWAELDQAYQEGVNSI